MTFTDQLISTIEIHPGSSRAELKNHMPKSKSLDKSFSGILSYLSKSGRVQVKTDPVSGRQRFYPANSTQAVGRKSKVVNTIAAFDALFDISHTSDVNHTVKLSAQLALEFLDTKPELARQLIKHITEVTS